MKISKAYKVILLTEVLVKHILSLSYVFPRWSMGTRNGFKSANKWAGYKTNITYPRHSGNPGHLFDNRSKMICAMPSEVYPGRFSRTRRVKFYSWSLL